MYSILCGPFDPRPLAVLGRGMSRTLIPFAMVCLTEDYHLAVQIQRPALFTTVQPTQIAHKRAYSLPAVPVEANF